MIAGCRLSPVGTWDTESGQPLLAKSEGIGQSKPSSGKFTSLSSTPTPAEVIGVALRNNLSLSIERERTLIAKSDLDGARGALDPRLTGIFTTEEDWSIGLTKRLALGTSLDLQHGTLIGRNAALANLSGVSGSDGTPRASRLEVRQPLLAGIGNGSEIILGRLDLSAQAYRERALALVVARDAVSAYWRAVYQQELLAIRTQEVAISIEIAEAVGELVTAGTLSGIDHLAAEVAQSRSEEARIDAQEAAKATRDRLWFVTGAARRSDPPELKDTLYFSRLPEIEDGHLPDPEAIYEVVKGSTPRTTALYALVERARVSRARARRNALPSLDLVASAERLEKGNQDIDISGQLQLEFPLFLREERALIARAEAELRLAQAEWESERQVVREEIRTACRELKSAGLRLKAARTGRDRSQTLLEEYRNLLSLGLVSGREISDALGELQQVESRVLGSRLDLALAQVALAALDGSLLPAHGYDWPSEESETAILKMP